MDVEQQQKHHLQHPVSDPSKGKPSSNTHTSHEKRAVAKKACLSCREKKIKCDGELVVSYPNESSLKKTFYKKCTNCKSAEIDCIFVPSKRGGRRKRKTPSNLLSSLPPASSKSDDNSSIVSSAVFNSDVVSNIPNPCQPNQFTSATITPAPTSTISSTATNNNNRNTAANSDNPAPANFNNDGIDPKVSSFYTSYPPQFQYSHPNNTLPSQFQMQQLQIHLQQRQPDHLQQRQPHHLQQQQPDHLQHHQQWSNNYLSVYPEMHQHFASSFAYRQQPPPRHLDGTDSKDPTPESINNSHLMMNHPHSSQQQPPLLNPHHYPLPPPPPPPPPPLSQHQFNPHLYSYSYPMFYVNNQQQGTHPLPLPPAVTEQFRQQQQQQQNNLNQPLLVSSQMQVPLSEQMRQQQQNPGQPLLISSQLPLQPADMHNYSTGQAQIQQDNAYMLQSNQHYLHNSPALQNNSIQPVAPNKASQLQQQSPSHPPLLPQNQQQEHESPENEQLDSIPAKRKLKYIDFEDKKSPHYLKKEQNHSISSTESDDREKQEPKFRSEENNVPIVEEGEEENDKSDVNNDDKAMDEDEDYYAVEDEDEDEDEDEVEDGNSSDINEVRDTDSWSVSLVPSDSVTMIQDKRKRLRSNKYEHKIQPITEEVSSNNQTHSLSNSNSKSGPQTNSKFKLKSNSDTKSKSHSKSTSTSTSTYESLKHMKQVSGSSKKNISTTALWINEQSSEIKKANEQSLINKRQKKFQGLELDIKFPPFINSELLDSLKLPSYQALYKLIGIYYKYSHPNFLILPNMSYFINNLSLSYDCIALLASMFKSSARYILNKEVSNELWLSESYWENIYLANKSKLSPESLLICSLVQCSRGDDNLVNDCIDLVPTTIYPECYITSTRDLVKLIIKKPIFNSVSLYKRELHVRIFWNIFKIQLYRRLSFGYPYTNDESDSQLTVDKSFELPLSDIQYYKYTENLSSFKDIYIKNFSLLSVSTANPNGSQLYDSACVPLTLVLLNEVMDSIANKTLFSYTILRFCHRLRKIYEIHNNFKHLQPYQLETHPKKDPHIIINASNFTSVFLNRLTCLLLSIGLSHDLLLYSPKTHKPFRSQLNPFGDTSIIEVDPKLVINKSDKITDMEGKVQSWLWFFKSIDVIFDLLILLELGDGICSATLTEKKPIGEIFETVVGPCCAGSSIVEEWCKYNTWTMNVSNVPVENQGWIQMPSVTVWAMAQAWPFLATLAVSLTAIDVVTFSDFDENGENNEDLESEVNSLSENEEDGRSQITADAYRVESEADFKKKRKHVNFNVGGTYDEAQFEANKHTKIKVICKETSQVLVSGIEYSSAPNIFNLLINKKNNNEVVNMLIEKMKIIRKFFGILEKYHGDCKTAATYCDNVLNYITKLSKED